MSWLRTAIDLLLPPRCAACAAPAWADPRSELCQTCHAGVPPPRARCAICARAVGPHAPTTAGCPACTGALGMRDALWRADRAQARMALSGVVAAWDYAGPARDLVLALKFARRLGAARPLARVLAAAVFAADTPGELVVPVPLSRRRRLARGFNQAALLARPLARRLDRAWTPHALRRSRHGPPQARTPHGSRVAAIRGAFVAHPRVVHGKGVLLVDDVLTTGATAQAAALALRRAGARTVHLAVACRAGQSSP